MLGTVKLLAVSAFHFLLICDEKYLPFLGGGSRFFFFNKIQPINDLHLDFVLSALSSCFEAKNETLFFALYDSHEKYILLKYCTTEI